MNQTISILYSCEWCGLEDIEVSVPTKEKEETVAKWLEVTSRLLFRDHNRRNLGCRPKTLQDVKIPLENTNRIGGQQSNEKTCIDN